MLGLSIFTGLCVFYLAVEYFSFTKSRYNCKIYTDKISIHFIHGSYPKKNCIDQRKSVGGLLGGHIEIEIDSVVYGFESENRQNIHIFPEKRSISFNSKFTLKQKEDWVKETEHDKITTIRIPVEASKRNQIVAKFQLNHKNAPYDYAFFGMRCASATYEDIAEAGILPKKARFQYIVNAFYPRQLRNRMLRWARYNNIAVEYKGGIKCRVWE